MTGVTSWTIRSGGHEAVIGRTGAGVRGYRVDGVPVVDALGEREVASAYHGLVLAPWPNRVPDGRWSWAGQELELPVNEASSGCALHGLVAFSAWQLLERTEDAVELGVSVEPQPGYPFALDLAVRWSVGADGLRCAISVVNTGWEAAPFGVAVHPYVVLPGCGVDDLQLILPAASWLETDDRLRPVALHPVDGGARDFRAGAALRGRSLDTAFTDVTGDRARVSGGDRAVEVWADPAFGWWQVYTSDYFPPGSERYRHALAVEAMTCGPDAFNTGRDLLVLEPGARWGAAWGVRAS
ncbi:aldose 1-epimerase family protein [Modestobacter sp. SSW1-42]|uniref:aldose 1-epimerase family protein n=1 Tax=Modestobacter sp. SSW1-42 TaxID=596372 RepID=UPI003987D3D1